MASYLEQLSDYFVESTGVCTDSRKVLQGNVFFALKGENFDGNEYAAKALEGGAICAVVSKESRFGKEVVENNIPRCIVVDDTLKALQELANWHRKRFKIPVLALTGTNGKTTTKELITAVLSKKFRVASTVGNLNNSIGVPLTLFSINSQTQIAIIEMGASHPGDIKELVDIAEPTMGLITNVGKAHLLGFGSFEGVMRTKGELYDFLKKRSGVTFLNTDNQYLREMVSKRGFMKQITYGLRADKAALLPVDANEPFLRIKMKGKTIKTNLVGSYNADNVLAAIAVGNYFGVPFERVREAISNYTPVNNRSELRRSSSNLLVVDAYNANPTSMRASLENFAATGFENKALILGDMRELGESSLNEHRAILDLVSSMNVKEAIFVGTEFKSVSESIKDVNPEWIFFLNVEELKEYLQNSPLCGFTILIKGSNGVGLQRVIDML